MGSLRPLADPCNKVAMYRIFPHLPRAANDIYMAQAVTYLIALAEKRQTVEGLPAWLKQGRPGVANLEPAIQFLLDQCLYGSPDISGPECTFYRRPRFDNRQPYRAGGAEAQATAQSERTRPGLLANRFQAISQASMMSARLENTELASQ